MGAAAAAGGQRAAARVRLPAGRPRLPPGRVRGAARPVPAQAGPGADCPRPLPCASRPHSAQSSTPLPMRKQAHAPQSCAPCPPPPCPAQTGPGRSLISHCHLSTLPCPAQAGPGVPPPQAGTALSVLRCPGAPTCCAAHAADQLQAAVAPFKSPARCLHCHVCLQGPPRRGAQQHMGAGRRTAACSTR